MNDNKSIKIAGAGISGLTAAINLAKAGYNVIVYEKNNDVGMRHNNDFQGLENWSTEEDILNLLKEWGIEINFNYIPFKNFSWYSYNLEKFDFLNTKPFFYLVQRGKENGFLDSSLKSQALKLGVNIKFNRVISPEEIDIVATGPQIKNLKYNKNFGFNIGITFQTDINNLGVAILNDCIAPKGYTYFFVANHRATIAVAFTQHFKRSNEFLDKAIKTFKFLYQFSIINPKRFSGIAYFTLDSPKDKITVGEAAGLQDALWGFGMRYAFYSGYLAAISIIENKNYYNLIKKYILPFKKSSASNRFIFEKLGNRGYKLFLKYYLSKKPQEIINKNYHPSLFKKFLYPIAKFRFI